jgi:hypothetical protein
MLTQDKVLMEANEQMQAYCTSNNVIIDSVAGGYDLMTVAVMEPMQK